MITYFYGFCFKVDFIIKVNIGYGFVYNIFLLIFFAWYLFLYNIFLFYYTDACF
ncbi:hypothetical protein AC45_0071 [Escherichia coli 2-210-07_S3_C3]|nr:hypothetical protein AC45_0071 [Escherichia coli 2-210-07_S3_C3]